MTSGSMIMGGIVHLSGSFGSQLIGGSSQESGSSAQDGSMIIGLTGVQSSPSQDGSMIIGLTGVRLHPRKMDQGLSD